MRGVSEIKHLRDDGSDSVFHHTTLLLMIFPSQQHTFTTYGDTGGKTPPDELMRTFFF